MSDTPAGTAERNAELHAICEGCHFPADPDTSVLWIDLRKALDAVETPHLEVHPFEDATLAHWRIHHVRCIPGDVGPYYDLDLDVVIQPGRLAEHTRHLSLKRWLAHTDWYAVVATAETGRLVTASERAA
jgi:hypothetical protein